MPAFINRCNKISEKILKGSENSFYRLGEYIAKNPWRTIIFCLIFVSLSLLGFLRFHQEKNPLKLWVPPNSNFYSDTIWLMKTYKTAIRPQTIIVTAPNVLSPFILKQVALINNKVEKSKEGNVTWSDVCFKIPMLELASSIPNPNHSKNNSELFFFGFDPSITLNNYLYCAILSHLKFECLTMSLVDIWKSDIKRIEELSLQDVINDINTVKISPVYGHLMDYSSLLGGVIRNKTGHIISAKSLLSNWLVNVHFDDVNMDVVGNDVGTADWASEASIKWENAFLKTMQEIVQDSNGIGIFYEAGRSFGDVSGATMFQDMDKLVLGIALMIIYVQFVLSNFNWLECRSILGGLGLLCVGMAFISACGICSLIGISYGPVHTSLPFLLMGLGVDDMFVMMASWKQLDNREKKSLSQRIGEMLKHAGPSITLTSFTDVMAFIIGASTILPSLESFCLYAAVGVFLTYIFVLTFFTASFVLDQIRIEQNRNAILFCCQHESYEYPQCSRKQYSKIIIEYIYSNVILTKIGKVAVILITLICTGISLQNAVKLEQRFDPNWFIPEDTYLHSFIIQRNKYYPLMGKEASLFFGKLNYSYEFMNIHHLAMNLQNRTDIVNNVDTWTIHFINYAQELDEEFNPYSISEDKWSTYLSRFLFSPRGGKYQKNFRFENELVCGEPVSKIKVSSIEFRFNVFNGPEETLPAKHAIENLVRRNNFTTGDRFATVWAKIFGSWVTDEVIETEVIRNLLLALGCVMFCTILLITNIQMCFWIFLCVLLTMINICGFMQKWGLHIDIVSCIGLELAIGLCVDFATHIGHTFLTCTQGDRQKRALDTVRFIGAAIFFGGGSTLLALSMLSQSDAYVFQSFFQIFLLVIIFGLFNGVVLLPVILSLIGPQPYKHLEIILENDICETEELNTLNKHI